MRKLKLLGCVICMAAAATSCFGASAADVIRRSQAAGRFVSYRGLKTASVYFAGRHAVSNLKVVHLMPDKTRTEFYSPDVLAGVVVIQSGNKVWKFSPEDDQWEQANFDARYVDGTQLNLSSNYELKMLGTDEVAGRPTYVVFASPRNHNESAKRLWVDQASYLITRMQTEDQRGAVINSSRFTRIEMNPKDISPSSFKVSGKVATCPKSAGGQFVAVKPKYIPAGYRLIATSTLSINCMCCAHLQYSNGANVISFFQRKGDGVKDPMPKKSNVMNVLTWSRRGMVFTLMGDVSSKELRKIADSIP